MKWFLYDNGLHHERVNYNSISITIDFQINATIARSFCRRKSFHGIFIISLRYQSTAIT